MLIAALLTDDELVDYLTLCAQLELDPLVEVHTHEELQRVLATDAPIIGINNRNLYTFEVSIETSIKLMQYVPSDRITVSESGIESRDDIETLQKVGINAFLIGEALMKEEDIGKKLREFLF